MKKWALPIVLSLSMPAAPAVAQFVGPFVEGKPSTVAEARRAGSGSYVVVTGNILAHQRILFHILQSHRRDPCGDRAQCLALSLGILDASRCATCAKRVDHGSLFWCTSLEHEPPPS